MLRKKNKRVMMEVKWQSLKIGEIKRARVAEADARFKVAPPQRIGRVRLLGELGEQLVLSVKS